MFEVNPLNYSPAVIVICIIISILFSIFCIVANYLFFSHSETRLISVRRPLIVGFTHFMAVLWIIFVWLFNGFFAGNCISGYFIQCMLTFCAIHSYLLRSFSLYVAFKRQEEINSGTPGFFAKHHPDKLVYLFLFLLIGVIINSFVSVAFILMEPDPYVETETGCLHFSNSSALYTASQVIICAIGFGILAWLMRGKQDAFKIKNEFRYLAWIGGIGGIFWILVKRIGVLADLNHDYFPIRSAWLSLAIASATGVSTIYPFLLARAENKEDKYTALQKATAASRSNSLASNSSGKPSFQQAMTDDILSQHFREYLLKEFAIENILFIQAVDILKKNFQKLSQKSKNAPSCRGQVSLIMDNYIYDNSPMQINLSERIREGLISKYNELDSKSLTDEEFANNVIESNLFDDSYSAIQLLLECGCFTRWLDSDDFQRATLVDNSSIEIEM